MISYHKSVPNHKFEKVLSKMQVMQKLQKGKNKLISKKNSQQILSGMDWKGVEYYGWLFFVWS